MQTNMESVVSFLSALMMMVLYQKDPALIFRKKSLLKRKRRVGRISSLAGMPPSGCLRYWYKKSVSGPSLKWLHRIVKFSTSRKTPFCAFIFTPNRNTCCIFTLISPYRCTGERRSGWRARLSFLSSAICSRRHALSLFREMFGKCLWGSHELPLIAPKGHKEICHRGSQWGATFSSFGNFKKENASLLKMLKLWTFFPLFFFFLPQRLPTFFFWAADFENHFVFFGGSQVGVCDGGMLRVRGGQGDQEDQRRHRGAAAQRQEGLPQGAEAAAVGWASLRGGGNSTADPSRRKPILL